MDSIQEQYNRRLTRVMKAVRLETPDRVPLIPQPQAFPVYYSGLTMQECMEDYRKVGPALDKFYRDFPQADLAWSPILIYAADVMRTPGLNWLKWPGNGIDNPLEMYQFIEGEYMETHEYDEFIEDPTHFIQSKWLPRSFSGLKGLSRLNLKNSLWLNWMGSFTAFADPEVLETLETLHRSALELLKWFRYLDEYENRLKTELGFPPAAGAFGFAPFDQLGDTMRGTVNILTDLMDRPEKVLAAIEKIIPMAIQGPVEACKAKGGQFVWLWLHKGIDQFMSLEQFKTFYWPGLKALIDGLVAADLTPVVYCEGSYNEQRMEILRDVEKGKVIYDFEEADMFRAKEILGDRACIAGNVPNALLAFGNPGEVDGYCRKLIEGIGRDGGFMLDAGALIDNAKTENMQAFFRSVEKYGR